MVRISSGGVFSLKRVTVVTIQVEDVVLGDDPTADREGDGSQRYNLEIQL